MMNTIHEQLPPVNLNACDVNVASEKSMSSIRIYKSSIRIYKASYITWIIYILIIANNVIYQLL